MPSPHAIQAIERLRESWFINWMVRGSIHDPSMGGHEHHPNWRLFGAMERYLSVQQICHAGDTLNTYCDSMLAEILHAAPAEWENVKRLLKGKNLLETVERLRNHRQLGAREAIRDGIATYWSPESDIVVILRNKLVHQGGHDKEREVEKMVASKNGQACIIQPVDLPPDVVPISYNGDELVVDAQTGVWACRHIQNHVHLMDQDLCHRFSLPTKRHRSRPLSFTGYASQKTLPFPPGTPLPTDAPPERPGEVPSTPEIAPDYSMLMDEKEITCAQTRLRFRNELDQIFRTYCDESGVAIVGIAGGMPGSLMPHTIRWHDLSLVYHLQEQDRSRDKSCRVEVRIREKNLEPFLTIFGHNSQMRDFMLPAGFEQGIEYLKECVDRALQS
ncbi:hypothetical protein DES53_102245 [Roseimicrobium gellanilyticum]|uniref:Uncharacterized protein n=1 Tax=Roseimicrobium gellanilyticum TaxID=748857 RepID=A0A366HQD4_9BACT|nr:hypothetical protein [Roseimicrobium gellanilyticum]RBP45861.1 hypothetical protein DES53_102245 [Roseimicrobium gellanilyticum]